MELAELKKMLLAGAKTIIVTHKNPDGDAIGSSLGLARVLVKSGADVSTIVPNDFPKFLNWMKGTEDIIVWENQQKKSTDLIKEAQIIFCLDFNALHRIGEVGEQVGASRAVKVMIDHHLEPGDFCDYVLSDTSASSTAELVHQFINELALEKSIDEHCAEALYCGIMTDTGSFKYPSTSAKTHDVIADLIRQGAANAKIHQLIYDSNSVSRLKLIGYCLDHMEILNNSVAFFTLPQSIHHELNLQKGDNEGIVNYGLSVAHIKISAFFREDEDLIKISFRSKGELDVNQFARKYFNGGGHRNAAGGVFHEGLEQAVLHFKQSINNFMNA